MAEDKTDQVIGDLKRRAREDVRFGEIVVEFKIHEGKILTGLVLKQRIRLG